MADDDTRWSTQTVTAAKLNALSLFAYANLAAFPSSTMEIGAKCLAEDSGTIYQNTGTKATPVWTSRVAGSPIGALTMWVGTEAGLATGWLICDGSAISRTTYATLFALTGTEYGVGDGSTTFNIPDFQTSSVFPRGATNDTARGATGGEATHALTIAELAVHTHTQDSHTHTVPVTVGQYGGVNTYSGQPIASAGNTGGTVATNQNTGSGTAHENLPPYVDVHFILKAL